MTAEPVTAMELMAVFVSRQVRNGEYIALGANLPVSTAGVLLAQLTHAPDVKINVINYFSNLSGIDRFDDLTQVANPRFKRWAEGIMSLELTLNAVPKMDLCFAGCLQVDPYGNINLIGVGKDPADLKLRGPGSVGTSTVMALVKRFFIFTGEHSRRTFVPECDFISAVGWGRGGKDARRKLGLPGGGPEYVISPKCIVDFEGETKRMRLKYLLPPATLEEVLENTGFELLVPDVVEEIEPPSATELEVLRKRVDPHGFLRRA